MSAIPWIVMFSAIFVQLGGFFAANITGEERIYNIWVVCAPITIFTIGSAMLYAQAT